MSPLFLVLACLCAPALSLRSMGRYRAVSPSSLDPVPNTTRYFTSQKLDHFNPQSHAVWTQRYFVNDTFFDPATGPVFLCVGGEGPPLAPTVVVTGDVHCALMVTLAAQRKGLILAIEHRFYGESIPTPDFSTENLRYLSSRQALADIAVFRDYIAQKYHLVNNKWMTFGGSYPGMLAAWARLKYPHLIHAAVSSSSPVQALENFEGYNDVVGASLAYALVGGSESCTMAVNLAFEALGAALGPADTRRALEKQFNTCGTQSLDDVNNQLQFMENLYNLYPAQTNDPACTAPGCNIASVCTIMLDASLGDPLARVARLNTLAQGGACLDVSYSEALAALLNTTVAGGTDRIWTYQTCAEFGFYQTCDPGSKCPFTRTPWLDTLKSSLDLCVLAYNITPAQVAANIAGSNAFYGGWQIGGTRILFVNGDVDPWHVQSVVKDLSPLVPALVVPGASHHAWTHPARPTDSPAIVKVRGQIAGYVDQWLAQNP